MSTTTTTTTSSMDGRKEEGIFENNIEEMAQILFGIKNQPSASSSPVPSSASIEPIKIDAEISHSSSDSLIDSPRGGGGNTPLSSSGSYIPMSPNQQTSPNHHSHNNGGSSNGNPFTKLSNNIFYSQSNSFSSIPIPSPRAQSPSSLASSTESLSCDSLVNSYSRISLSSSPSQSVPSSPPHFKFSKANHFKPIVGSPLSLSSGSIPQSHQSSSSSSSPSLFTPVKINPLNLHQSSNNITPVSPRSPRSSPRTTSPPLSPHGGMHMGKIANCPLNECLLCQRGQPDILLRSPTWASIMRVVFYTLHHEFKEKQFFSLKSDVYEFMVIHWDILCFNKKKSENWHKQIQDMLSHSKNIFESGMDTYKQNGFWRLKQLLDPWQIQRSGSLTNTTVRKPGYPPSPTPTPPMPSSFSSGGANASSPRSIGQTSPGSHNGSSGSATSPLILSSTPPSLHGPIPPTPIIPPLHFLRGQDQSPEDLRKRTSIDMLISTSIVDESDALSSPRKRRGLSDAANNRPVLPQSPRQQYSQSPKQTNLPPSPLLHLQQPQSPQLYQQHQPNSPRPNHLHHHHHHHHHHHSPHQSQVSYTEELLIDD